MSDYAKELFESGRGEELMKSFFHTCLLIKYHQQDIPKTLSISIKRWNTWREEDERD